MLSILIPTYNYNVLPLVYDVQFQARREHIEFEIIVFDDASTDLAIQSKNQQIGLIDNCFYKLLQQNVGRSRIRNLLAKKAKYHWLLFLDADTMPVSKDLVCQYLPYLTTEEKVVYGGVEYQRDKPAADKMLRWVYGRKREALPAYEREDAPYASLLTMNFAISKSIFDKVTFNEDISSYGYEDLVFSYNLSQHNIKVQHIHNPIVHLGLEPGEKFIKKFESSLTVYTYLVKNNIIPENFIKLGKMFRTIKRFGLQKIVAFGFTFFKKRIVHNLTGPKPSLFLFDIYRLGYLCRLKQED